MITKIFKLVSGEELIGRIESEFDNEFYTIYDPMYIVDAMLPDGTSYSKLSNAVAYCEEDHMIVRNSHVIACLNAKSIVEQYYKKVLAKSQIEDFEDMYSNGNNTVN